MLEIKQGDIVWVEVTDQADRNAKCRPAVVLTPTDEIDPDGEIVVAAATSTFDLPLPENQVKLPWAHDGHRRTGLNKPCVVVCDWLCAVDHAHVMRKGGTVPAAIFYEIMERVSHLPGADSA